MTEVSKQSEIAPFLFCLTVITVWCFIHSISVDWHRHVGYGPLLELRVLFCFEIIPVNIIVYYLYMKVKGYFFNNGLFKLRLQHLSELIKSFQLPLFIGNVSGVFIDKCTINLISNVYITVRSIGFPRECALDYDKDLFMKMRALSIV